MAIDDHCLRLLARWQPVASDLRFVAATLKLVTDLERVGDQCVNICRRVLELNHDTVLPAGGDIGPLARASRTMMADALAALEIEDAQLASHVIEQGSHTETLAREFLQVCLERLDADGINRPAIVRMHEIAGFLLRISAHATNIAEMVVFMVRGEDVRHPAAQTRASG